MNRKIDEFGRITIPLHMKQKLNLNNGDTINIELAKDKIIITNNDSPDPFEEWLIKNNNNDILTVYRELKK